MKNIIVLFLLCLVSFVAGPIGAQETETVEESCAAAQEDVKKQANQTKPEAMSPQVLLTQMSSCNGGTKTTYEKCPDCLPDQRQTRSQARCTETLDQQGNSCSGRSCEQCTCEPLNPTR